MLPTLAPNVHVNSAVHASSPVFIEPRVLYVQVTAYMEHLTSDLESAAHPALDAIISKVRFLLPDRAAALCRRQCCTPGVLQQARAVPSAVQKCQKYHSSQRRAESQHDINGL